MTERLIFAGKYLENMTFSGAQGERSTILLLYVTRFIYPGWYTLLMTEFVNGLFQGICEFEVRIVFGLVPPVFHLSVERATC